MFSMILLLFKASYWRHLLNGNTWRAAWSNLGRAHKDSRARKQLRQLLWLCLVPFLCVAYLCWLVGTTTIYCIPILIPVLWWWSRRNKQKNASLSILPPPAPVHRELSKSETEAFRRYFEDVALIYAVMLDRAGSETYLREKVLPEGYEVTTRQAHLGLLKSTNLWEKMDQRDREAMIAADGSWPKEFVEYLVMGLEPLRILRWILRIDHFLPAVGREMRLDYGHAGELAREPKKLRQTTEITSLKTMNVGRSAAQSYYNRCIAETIHRGYSEPKDEDSARIASDVATRYAGKQHEDLVIGQKLVSEVSQTELEWATMLSRRRLGFFHWTMLAMERGIPPEPPYKFQP